MIKLGKKDVPLGADGKPDIAAILAANGITDVDLSKVKVIQASNAEEADAIAKQVGDTTKKSEKE